MVENRRDGTELLALYTKLVSTLNLINIAGRQRQPSSSYAGEVCPRHSLTLTMMNHPVGSMIAV